MIIFFKTFIIVYISIIGAAWGFLEAYTYFENDDLRSMFGGYWILFYLLPIPIAIGVGLYRAKRKKQQPENENIDHDLIEQIQENVGNNDLENALILCLDLCHQAGLYEKYRLWINTELEGIDDIKGFFTQFDNDDVAEQWMEDWVKYRMIQVYIKAQLDDEVTGDPYIKKIHFGERFVSNPITNLILNYDIAIESENLEMYFLLGHLNEEEIQILQASFLNAANYPLHRETYLYYNANQLNIIINQVRNRILEILHEAREQ